MVVNSLQSTSTPRKSLKTKNWHLLSWLTSVFHTPWRCWGITDTQVWSRSIAYCVHCAHKHTCVCSMFPCSWMWAESRSSGSSRRRSEAQILRPAVPLPLGRKGPDAASGIRALSERTQIASRGERRDKDSGNYRRLTMQSMDVTEFVFRLTCRVFLCRCTLLAGEVILMTAPQQKFKTALL